MSDITDAPIDVLKLRGGLPSKLKNYNIFTVFDLMAHATGTKLPPLHCIPAIGEKSHTECVVKASKWLSSARWRMSQGVN